MFLSKPRIALLSALTAAALVGSLAMASLPASAATGRPASAAAGHTAEVLAAKGAILCSGDLCIQNDGYVGNDVAVEAWAYTSTFYGHFELTGDGFTENCTDNNQWWYAGGGGCEFDMPIQCTTSYVATAWAHLSQPEPHYSDIGRVTFGLGVC
jgi:hypothetical protein